MPPKRTRAASPSVQRPTKRKNLRNIDLFLDEEAEEASSGHNSEGEAYQKSEYSLAHLGESTLTDDDDDNAVDAASAAVNAASAAVDEASAAVNYVPDGSSASTESAPTPAAGLPLAPTSVSVAAPATVVLDPVPSYNAAASAVSTPIPVIATVPVTPSTVVASPTSAPIPSSASGVVDPAPTCVVASSTVATSAPVAASTSAAPPTTVAGPTPIPIPPPVVALDPDTDWGYGPKLNKRINRLMMFSNADELIYDITHVPVNAQIAAIEDSNGDDAYLLSVPGKKTAITIWVLGTVTRTYFRDRDGNLPKSISANIRALHESSLTAANNLLRTFTTYGPGENPERHDTIRASCWMNTKRTGDVADHIEEFRAVYDAKNAFLSPRTRMPTIFPQDIKKGDLVLLELHLGRYRKTLDDTTAGAKTSPNRRKGAKADAWTAFFTLKSVCVLDDTPKKVNPALDAPSGTWEL